MWRWRRWRWRSWVEAPSSAVTCRTPGSSPTAWPANNMSHWSLPTGEWTLTTHRWTCRTHSLPSHSRQVLILTSPLARLCSPSPLRKYRRLQQVSLSRDVTEWPERRKVEVKSGLLMRKSECVDAYVCLYVYTCVRVHVYTYMCESVRACVRTCMCVYVRACVRA